MIQAELIQQPVALNGETCSLYLPSCSKSPPQLYLYWSDHAVRWNRKATKKPDLLPTDCCHRNCWSLRYVAFHGHSHLPRDLCGSWESRGWSRSNGPAGHGGLQGRLQEMERQKHWQLQMRAQCWSSNRVVGSKPEEKVYASMAKYLERKDTEYLVIPNKERAYFVLEICRF